MPDAPKFGPYLKWDQVAAFNDISECAYRIFDAAVASNWNLFTTPTHHLFLRMAYQAKTTSFSLRLSNSWCYNMPALALLRVRLEQAIVCSFLIHEDEDVALDAFVRFTSIG